MNEEELLQKSKDLIAIKQKIKSLMSEANELKQEIMPAIKAHGAVKFDFGMVYYGESKGSASFSRKGVLDYLRDSYGDALADQVDHDCTKQGDPRQVVYVKVNDL